MCPISIFASYLALFISSITDQTFFTGKSGIHAETKLGTIKGRLAKSPQGTDVEEYLGIPFAKAPVGDLRYSDPEPVGKFPGGKYVCLFMPPVNC